MNRTMLFWGALGAACAAIGCASSYPSPTQRMADAIATVRGAEEVGANNNPQGQLHLRLAQEGLQNAKMLVDNGDNKRADFVLVRAKADADLALAEARQAKAVADAQTALQHVNDLQSAVTNAQGPGPAAPSGPVVIPPPASPNGGSR